jgi:hypothetical protein
VLFSIADIFPSFGIGVLSQAPALPQPLAAASLEGSVAYNQDTIENPKGGKLWLMPTIATIEYVVHEF